MQYFGDLHTHTAHSREFNNFIALRLAHYAEAKQKNPDLVVIGMVDHDTMNAIEPMYREKRKFAPGQLPIILPGIEVSASFKHPFKQDVIVETDILGYFPQLIEENSHSLIQVNAVMQPEMLRVIEGKQKKNVSLKLEYFMVQGVIPRSIDIKLLQQKVHERYQQDVLLMAANDPKSGDIINWPVHFSGKLVIDLLLELGIITSAKEGKLYTMRKRADYIQQLAEILMVRRGLGVEQAQELASKLQGSCQPSLSDDYYKISTFDAIKLIVKAGGIAVLAHPMVSIKQFGNDTDAFLSYCRQELLPLGLKGMEAFYPRQEEFTLQIIEFCQSNQLFITGGSDDHQDGRNSIGDNNSMCPLEYLQAMLPGLL
jgi:predicted metal-dependent phosphoesterase TrpH